MGRAERDNVRKFKSDWSDVLAEEGLINDYILDTRAALDWLKKDPKGTARLKTLVLNAKWRFESSDFLAKSAQDLIDLINSQSSE